MRTSGPLFLFLFAAILAILGGGAFLAGLAQSSGHTAIAGVILYVAACALVFLAFWLSGSTRHHG